MNESVIAGIATVFIQAGILIATVRFLGKLLDEHRKDTKQDLNGLGRKMRQLQAEQIIQAKNDPDFATIVRKLINGI